MNNHDKNLSKTLNKTLTSQCGVLGPSLQRDNRMKT